MQFMRFVLQYAVSLWGWYGQLAGCQGQTVATIGDDRQARRRCEEAGSCVSQLRVVCAPPLLNGGRLN